MRNGTEWQRLPSFATVVHDAPPGQQYDFESKYSRVCGDSAVDDGMQASVVSSATSSSEEVSSPCHQCSVGSPSPSPQGLQHSAQHSEEAQKDVTPMVTPRENRMESEESHMDAETLSYISSLTELSSTEVKPSFMGSMLSACKANAKASVNRQMSNIYITGSGETSSLATRIGSVDWITRRLRDKYNRTYHSEDGDIRCQHIAHLQKSMLQLQKALPTPAKSLLLSAIRSYMRMQCTPEELAETMKQLVDEHNVMIPLDDGPVKKKSVTCLNMCWKSKKPSDDQTMLADADEEAEDDEDSTPKKAPTRRGSGKRKLAAREATAAAAMAAAAAIAASVATKRHREETPKRVEPPPPPPQEDGKRRRIPSRRLSPDEFEPEPAVRRRLAVRRREQPPARAAPEPAAAAAAAVAGDAEDDDDADDADEREADGAAAAGGSGAWEALLSVCRMRGNEGT